MCFASPHRAVRVRRAHRRQPQAVAAGGEPLSLPGLVSRSTKNNKRNRISAFRGLTGCSYVKNDRRMWECKLKESANVEVTCRISFGDFFSISCPKTSMISTSDGSNYRLL